MAIAADSVVSVTRGAFLPYLKSGLIEAEINLLTASSELTAQGDGELAAGDVITVFSLPAGTLIIAAGIEVTTLVTGSTALVLDLGTGDDDDQFLDGSDGTNPFDIGSSGSQKDVGTYSEPSASVTTTLAGMPKMLSAADTLDITVQGITGTLSAGVVRVWALIADVDGLEG